VEITKIPAQVLLEKTQPLSSDEIASHQSFFQEMKEAMKKNEGIGLAANQLGKNLSVFVIDEKLAQEYDVPQIYINPEITEYSKDQDDLEEGCLSIPKYYVPIPRSKKVKIKALDEQGNKIKLKARGFLARVFQHETDHLNGIIIKDRVKKKKE